MKVSLNVKQFQEVLDILGKFVSKHSTLPILENIYLKTNIDTLILRATDMEKYVEISLPTKIHAEGAITVNAKTISDIVRTLDDEMVDLNVDQSKDTITIKTTGDNFKIKGIAATEYVALPEVNKDKPISLEINTFARGITKVEFAVTEKNFSPVLTGVLIRMKQYEDDKKIVFVGTDGFRLAEYKTHFEGEINEKGLIIPKTSINDIKKVAEYIHNKGGEKITMYASENLICFECQHEGMNIIATSLLIHGNFPEYENENIMPKNFNTTVMVDKNSIDKAIKKIGIMTKDINNYVVLGITNDGINIQSGETDKGEAQTMISAKCEGTDVTIGLNGKHVADFCRMIDSENMQINIVGSDKPLIINDMSDTHYRCVIRPLVK